MSVPRHITPYKTASVKPSHVALTAESTLNHMNFTQEVSEEVLT